MTHDPHPVRAKDGWVRWAAECPCGWSARANGRDDAQARTAEHAAITRALAIVEAEIGEECYDAAAMEFSGDGPCLRCRLRATLGGAA